MDQNDESRKGSSWTWPVVAGVAVAAAASVAFFRVSEHHQNSSEQKIDCPATATGLQAVQCNIERALGRTADL